METITLPIPFLESVGNLALEAQRLALRFMPFVIMLVFAFGLVSFLLGSSNGKLDFKKFLFTPLFLLLLIVNYPTVIDITGKFYGMVISVFDKPSNKDFYLKYTGVEEELKGLKEVAEEELAKYQRSLKNDKAHQEWLEKTYGATYTDADRQARKEAIAAIDEKMNTSKELGKGQMASKIFDFFKLPTVRIIRYILDLTRNLALSFLVIIGCIAIMFECIPVFRGILNKWFKFYTAVTFWALTICILDAAFLSFAEAGVASAKHFLENATVVGTYQTSDANVGNMMDSYNQLYGRGSSSASGLREVVATDFAIKWYAYGGSQGLNTAVNVVMVIFYCMVPFLTSLYIGGEQAGMFMSKVIGVGAMATQQIMQTGAGITTAAGSGVGAGVGGYKGSVIGQSLGTMVGSVGGAAGVVTASGSS
jgi:hypothetical protein